jgi:hypothetical protein
MDTAQTYAPGVELKTLLQNAVDAEVRAIGTSRRRQFRLTRRLLTAARISGAPVSEIAAILGRSTPGLRTRATEEGVISAADFSALSSVPPGEIAAWEASGRLSRPIAEFDGYVGYPATDLLQAYLTTHGVCSPGRVVEETA